MKRGNIPLATLTVEVRKILDKWSYEECKVFSDHMKIQSTVNQTNTNSMTYFEIFRQLNLVIQAETRKKYPRQLVQLDNGKRLEIAIGIDPTTAEGQVILNFADAVEIDQPTLFSRTDVQSTRLRLYDLDLLEQYLEMYIDFLQYGSTHTGMSFYATVQSFLRRVHKHRELMEKGGCYPLLYGRKLR